MSHLNMRADLKEADLREANLREAENLTANQLCEAYLLVGAPLDPEIKKQTEKECPLLFNKPE